MTVQNTPRRAGPYVSDGVQTEFPFEFLVFAGSDVQVVTGESNVLLSSAYSIAINSDQRTNPGGTVNLVAPQPSTTKITILSVVEESQATQITNQSAFYPKVIEGSLDRAVILIQQLSERLGRSLTLPVGDFSNPALVLANLRQLLIDLPIEVQARIIGDQTQRNYTDGRFDAIAPLLAATADAEALLRSYIDGVIMNVSFPLDCGLISDPVINNRFDLGAL